MDLCPPDWIILESYHKIDSMQITSLGSEIELLKTNLQRPSTDKLRSKIFDYMKKY